MVPHFNVKFNCLGKATNNKNWDLYEIESDNGKWFIC